MSAKIHNLLNFFKKIGSEGHEAFVVGWRHTADLVNQNPHFMRTQLHKNLDQEGGLYKYVNYAQFNSDQFAGFRRELATPEWREEMKKSVASGREAIPGGFFEIATFSGQPMTPAKPLKDTSVFLVSTYQGENIDVSEMESSWKEWSGASLIKEQSPKEAGFHDIALYKPFTNSPFLYVTRAEFTDLEKGSKFASQLLDAVRNNALPNGVTANSDFYCVIPESILDKTE